MGVLNEKRCNTPWSNLFSTTLQKVGFALLFLKVDLVPHFTNANNLRNNHT